ncbi:MAG TPA: transcriptional repressor LexA [Bdellovibrionota bacterium]|jgi:repressor LexA|nr:transcriptional repressor LexA [Bdellovibrionota bacterium]
MGANLSERQKELLNFIEACVHQEQRIPSYREMAKHLGVSAVGTIQDHIHALTKFGYLEKKGRSLRLSGHRQSPTMSIPIVGEVAAGALQDAFEVALGTLQVSPATIRNPKNSGAYFALKVRGESMIDIGIYEGDYLVVDREAKTKSGDVVVAQHLNQATVKTIQYPKSKSDPVALIPQNAKMKPILVDPDEEFQVLGKVVALQRFY